MNRREFLAAGLAAAPLLRCAAQPMVAAREPLALVTADTEGHASQAQDLLSGARTGRSSAA